MIQYTISHQCQHQSADMARRLHHLYQLVHKNYWDEAADRDHLNTQNKTVQLTKRSSKIIQ